MTKTTRIATALAALIAVGGAYAQAGADGAAPTTTYQSSPDSGRPENAAAPTPQPSAYSGTAAGSNYSDAANQPATRENTRMEAARAVRNGTIPSGEAASVQWEKSPNVFQGATKPSVH